MKYLKKFNESKLGDELEEFCKEYLAYLTDGKFECYINSSDIDIFDLYKIGRFCDAVDDFGYFQGVPDNAGGLEPRFSCNIMFTENMKIFDALNTISALFRGIIYYNNSQINFVDDRPKDTIALFTNTIVIFSPRCAA